MSPHRTLSEESIQKMLAERDDSISRGDVKRFLELNAILGMETEPEYGDQIERYQADLMMDTGRGDMRIPQARPETVIDYQALLKIEGFNFGMGEDNLRRYLKHFGEYEVAQIWRGWNNLVLKPEMLILYPEGSIILPFAADLAKRTGNPKYSHLFVTNDPYELVSGLNEVAFSYEKIRKMHVEYQKSKHDKPELILHPGDLEKRLRYLPDEAKDRLVGSFKEDYYRAEWNPSGTSQIRKEIILKINQQYEKAIEKYGTKK